MGRKIVIDWLIFWFLLHTEQLFSITTVVLPVILQKHPKLNSVQTIYIHSWCQSFRGLTISYHVWLFQTELFYHNMTNSAAERFALNNSFWHPTVYKNSPLLCSYSAVRRSVRATLISGSRVANRNQSKNIRKTGCNTSFSDSILLLNDTICEIPTFLWQLIWKSDENTT